MKFMAYKMEKQSEIQWFSIIKIKYVIANGTT